MINAQGSTNYALDKTIYRSTDNDIGNMLCQQDKIYFIKTLSENKRMNLKTTDVAEVILKTGAISMKSDLQKVTQIISVDGRVLIPFRDDYFVVDGEANLSQDRLMKQMTPQKPKGNE